MILGVKRQAGWGPGGLAGLRANLAESCHGATQAHRAEHPGLRLELGIRDGRGDDSEHVRPVNPCTQNEMQSVVRPEPVRRHHGVERVPSERPAASSKSAARVTSNPLEVNSGARDSAKDGSGFTRRI